MNVVVLRKRHPDLNWTTIPPTYRGGRACWRGIGEKREVTIYPIWRIGKVEERNVTCYIRYRVKENSLKPIWYEIWLKKNYS